MHDIKLPKPVINNYVNLNCNNCYDVIFHLGAGGDRTKCYGYIVDHITTDIKKEINIYRWNLPSLKSDFTRPLYSTKYGLIQIGGYKQTFHS